MKLTNVITFLFAAATVAPLTAQQPADPTVMLNVLAQPKGAKGVGFFRLLQPPAVAKGALRIVPVSNSGDAEPRDLTTKDFKVLMVMTPPELAEAQRTYAGGNLSSAKTQLAAVRSKYSNFAGLPDSPAVKAAGLELRCLARLQDWDGLGKAVEAFPHPRLQSSTDRAVLEAARLLSQVSDDVATAPARLKALDTLLADGAKMKRLNTTEYGWLKYAQGRALASGLPTDAIPEDKVQQASQAVDAFCESAVCYRGGDMELAADAMTRAFHLLWAMPGVKAYGLAAKKMDIKKWNDAPANFRDAVALANMLTTIFAPDTKDNAVQQAAGYFVNALEGKKPAAPAGK